MNTEKHIVYELLNIIRNHEHNNDEPVTERLMRAYLKTYRSDLIRKHYKDEMNIPDECLQITSLNLVRKNQSEFTGSLPKIIRLKNHAGFSVYINGAPVPVVDSEEYHLSKTNPLGKQNFFGKAEGSKLTVFQPLTSRRLNADSVLLENIKVAETDRSEFTLSCILTDPSDDPEYDWENDVYPFPSEKESELIVTILRQVFGISFQFKPDQVQNAASDNINYHENLQVNGGN